MAMSLLRPSLLHIAIVPIGDLLVLLGFVGTRWLQLHGHHWHTHIYCTNVLIATCEVFKLDLFYCCSWAILGLIWFAKDGSYGKLESCLCLWVWWASLLSRWIISLNQFRIYVTTCNIGKDTCTYWHLTTCCIWGDSQQSFATLNWCTCLVYALVEDTCIWWGDLLLLLLPLKSSLCRG